MEAIAHRELGLSEVRNKLLNAIKKLKESKKFFDLQSKQLAEFWDRTYPAAPFEELFTYKQISEINIDTFFKKRSVVSSKILGIIASIENAISDKKIKTPKKLTGKKSASKKPGPNNKLKYFKLQYTLLLEKCRTISEALELAENIEIKKATLKNLSILDKDIKKIDSLLTSNYKIISKIIK